MRVIELVLVEKTDENDVVCIEVEEKYHKTNNMYVIGEGDKDE